MINVKLVVIKKFSQMIISGLDCAGSENLNRKLKIINCFLYKSINVYWPNGLAPTQYTDFDFYSSTSGNYTNWFGSEIFCFIFWLANENVRNGKLFSSNFIGQLSSQWRHLVFAAYFCSQPLISASTFSPAWSLFSRPTMKLTPSTTIWTNESSEKPRRSALEISNIPPSEAVSTPP